MKVRNVAVGLVLGCLLILMSEMTHLSLTNPGEISQLLQKRVSNSPSFAKLLLEKVPSLPTEAHAAVLDALKNAQIIRKVGRGETWTPVVSEIPEPDKKELARLLMKRSLTDSRIQVWSNALDLVNKMAPELLMTAPAR